MIKNSIEIASKLSTIGIFILATFGYFYTVKPKYELDNLKIHSSQLDKRNIVLKKEIHKNKIKIIKAKKEAKMSIELLNSTIKELTNIEVKKTKLANKLNKKIISSKKKISLIKKEKEKALNQYNTILWNLYINDIKNIGYGKDRWDDVTKINDETGELTVNINEDINIIKLNVIDLKILDKNIAFKVIKKRLPFISNEFIPKKYLKKFTLFSKNFIDNHQNDLINKKLDKQYYINLMNAYNSDILKIEIEFQKIENTHNNNLKKIKDEFNKIKNPTQLEGVKYRNKKVDLFNNYYENYWDKLRTKDKKIYQIIDNFNKELEKQYIVVQKLIDKIIYNLNLSYNKTHKPLSSLTATLKQ
jgi:hypothetical protein